MVMGAAMVLLTFLKLVHTIEISSDWFWFIAGIGLVIEGYIAMKKEREFKRKFKVISKEEYDRLSIKK